jgi:hypothetical protein
MLNALQLNLSGIEFMGVAVSDESNLKTEIEELLYNWIYWLMTRRFYAPPLPPNILALLQVDRRPSKEPPNARNDALCVAFNLIITQAADGDRLPFLYVYLPKHRPQPIKGLAFDLGIDRDTVYERAYAVAPKYLRQAKELAELNAQMQREVEEHIDD